MLLWAGAKKLEPQKVHFYIIAYIRISTENITGDQNLECRWTFCMFFCTWRSLSSRPLLWKFSSGQKLNFYFRGLLFTSHWLNLQHWTGFYIAVYGNFQGLFFDFRGFFCAFRGQNRPEPPCNFSPASHHSKYNKFFNCSSEILEFDDSCHQICYKIFLYHMILVNINFKQCWGQDQRCQDQGQAQKWKSHRLCTGLHVAQDQAQDQDKEKSRSRLVLTPTLFSWTGEKATE